jgi:hypothetical protein
MAMSMISGSPAPQGIPAQSLMGGVVASLKCWWVVWSGEHALTLADEAKRAIALIDGSAGKVHLVPRRGSRAQRGAGPGCPKCDGLLGLVISNRP